MFKLPVFVCLYLVLNIYSSFALDTDKPFNFFLHNQWSSEDGLPLNSVLTMAQTPEGYLWLGTEVGIARFDGVKFDLFTKENTPAFENAIVLTLLAERKGPLWIGTRGGGVIRFLDGDFKTFTVDNGLLSNEVWSLAESGDGSIWMGTRNGVNYFQNGRLFTLPLPKSLSSHYVKAILVDRKGRIWVGTVGGGLVLVEKRGERFEAEYKYLAGKIITTLFEDHLGNIWAGTKEHGLTRIRGNEQFVFNTENGLSGNQIKCICEDPEGNLWIGTKGGGISIYPDRKEKMFPFDDQGTLGSKWINSLAVDQEGTLWIGAQAGGLHSLRDTKISTYTRKNGLSANAVYGVFQDSGGDIWIGTKGFGVNRLRPGNGKIQVYTTREGLSSDAVISMAETPNDILWFGTLGGGINRLALSSGHIDVFTRADGLADNFVRALYTDAGDTLWAGTGNGHIHRFENGTFTLYKNVKFRVNAILKDREGTLWAATFGGGLLRIKDGNIEAFNKKNGLSGNYVTCLYEDKDGAIWLGTLGSGIDRYKDGIFTHFSKKNGLPDSSIHVFLEDRKNHLWMSSNRGIFCLNRKDIDEFVAGKLNLVTPSVFGVDDGMKSSECNGGNQPPGWRGGDGKLWFPSTKGVSVLDPENIAVNTMPPPIVIEKMIVDGESRGLVNGKPVVVPVGKKNLEIQYTALSFIGPKKILFKFRLEGWEEKWRNVETRRFAVYNNLPPGPYTFRVTACNSDGIWNDTDASLELYLEYKFDQTVAFKIGFPITVFLIVLLLYFSIKKYIAYRRLHRKYKGTVLSPEKSSEYLAKFYYLIENEKIYRDPNLSLESLAAKLKIKPRKISQVLNEHLHKNFYTVINHYRVEEAKKKMLSSDETDLTILDICFEVGFNSKSSFNRVFKSFTGKTPSQFRKEKGNK